MYGAERKPLSWDPERFEPLPHGFALEFGVKRPGSDPQAAPAEPHDYGRDKKDQKDIEENPRNASRYHGEATESQKSRHNLAVVVPRCRQRKRAAYRAVTTLIPAAVAAGVGRRSEGPGWRKRSRASSAVGPSNTVRAAR